MGPISCESSIELVAGHCGIQCGGFLWNIHLHVNHEMNNNAFALSIYPFHDRLDNKMLANYRLEYTVATKVFTPHSGYESQHRLMQHQWTKRTDAISERFKVYESAFDEHSREIEELPFSRDDLIGSQNGDEEDHFYLEISIKTKFLQRSRSLICAPYRGMIKSRPQYSGVFGAILLQTEKRLEEVEQKNERLKQKNHDLEQQLIGSNRAQEQFGTLHSAALDRMERQLKRLGDREDEIRRLKEKNDLLRERCRSEARSKDTGALPLIEMDSQESKQQDDGDEELKQDATAQTIAVPPHEQCPMGIVLDLNAQNDRMQFVYEPVKAWRYD